MKIKKSIALMLATLLLSTGTVVGAKTKISIKGANDKIIEYDKDTISINNGNKTTNVTVDNITITNGKDKISIEDSEEKPDNSNKILGVVTTSGLNVRTGPGTNYPILGSVWLNETVTIIEETSNGWYKIVFGSGTGYASGDYIRLTQGKPPVTNEGVTGPTGPIKTIVIDAGHGGSDPGAIGPNGLKEKDVVLTTSLKIRDMLQARGYTVKMTRTTDVYLTLQERVNISNASGADFFLSVHANSFSNPESNGTETFAYSSYGLAADVSRLIQNKLVAANGLRNRGFKTEGFYVLRYNNIPASLVELAFISNYNEESLMRQDSFLTLSAAAIVDAIDSYKK